MAQEQESLARPYFRLSAPSSIVALVASAFVTWGMYSGIVRAHSHAAGFAVANLVLVGGLLAVHDFLWVGSRRGTHGIALVVALGGLVVLAALQMKGAVLAWGLMTICSYFVGISASFFLGRLYDATFNRPRPCVHGDLELLVWSERGLRRCPHLSLSEAVASLDSRKLAYIRAVRGRAALEIGGGRGGQSVVYYTENYPDRDSWRLALRKGEAGKWAMFDIAYGQARIDLRMCTTKSRACRIAEEFEKTGHVATDRGLWLEGPRVRRLRPRCLPTPRLGSGRTVEELSGAGAVRVESGTGIDVVLYSRAGEATSGEPAPVHAVAGMLDGDSCSLVRICRDDAAIELAGGNGGNVVIYWASDMLEEDAWKVAIAPDDGLASAEDEREMQVGPSIGHIPVRYCLTRQQAQELVDAFVSGVQLDGEGRQWLAGPQAQALHPQMP